MTPTVLELCAGAGGQALGFESAGFDHAALIDNDRHACATLRMNRPYWNVVEGDLAQLPTDYWRGVDMVAAGLHARRSLSQGNSLGRMMTETCSLFCFKSWKQPNLEQCWSRTFAV